MSDENKSTKEIDWGSKHSAASHDEWAFRREAFIWEGDAPLFPNIRSISVELKAWMLREGNVNYLFHTDKTRLNAPTNPYTYDAYYLAMAYMGIINDAHAFGTSNERMRSLDAEVKYLRLSSELLLNTTRLCEVLIKQLLFCTDFLPRQYDTAALGNLLSRRCRACQNAGKKYFVSLTGSLTHRYGLCNTFDNCLHEKMQIVNSHRNTSAAHAGTPEFRGRLLKESRTRMLEDMDRIGNEFIHMLNHIGDLETRITNEINAIIRFERTAKIEIRFPIKL